MKAKKRIALVAHDHKKTEMVDWVKNHKSILTNHELYGTGTTGGLIEKAINQSVVKLLSGPLGGDQQIGALIAEQKLDMLIFFWDPMESLPHDPDIKALLRIAAVWNIPIACSIASADFMISSPLMGVPYDKIEPDYSKYTSRKI